MNSGMKKVFCALAAAMVWANKCKAGWRCTKCGQTGHA